MRGVLLVICLAGCHQLFGLLEVDPDPNELDDAHPVDTLASDADASCWNASIAGDEDLDNISNGCDACPLDLGNANVDGDDMADACDPEPNRAAQRLVAFDGFDAAGAWQTSGGTWSLDQGVFIREDESGDEEATLTIAATSRPGLDVVFNAAFPQGNGAAVFMLLGTKRVECGHRYALNGMYTAELSIDGLVIDSALVDGQTETRVTLWQDSGGAIRCRVRHGLASPELGLAAVSETSTVSVGFVTRSLAAKLRAFTVFSN